MTIHPITRASLLERAAEIATLEALVDEAAAGRGAVAAVVGRAGIGKTSLLGAARDRAAASGLSVLFARGGELEREFSYGVVRQLLERPLRELPDAAAILDGAARSAAPALGLTDGALEDHFAVVHGLFWVCANLAAQRPILLAVDDAHWVDAPSLRFLAYLARRVEELPLLLLVTARPGIESASADLLEAVVESPDVRSLRPRPLSREAVGELLSAELGGAADPDLAAACREATGGNPFLCRALIAALSERPAPLEPSDVASVAGGAVSNLVMRRLGRLPPAATELARAVAILGAHADLRHAVALAGLSQDVGAAAADALAAQEIVRVGRPLEFVHALVQAAVIDQMPPAARLRTHARAAKQLADAGAPAEAVAAQLMSAQPAGEHWAVDWLTRVAERAAARGAPDVAVAYLRRALEEAGPTAGLLHRLGAIEIQASAPVEAALHLEEALRLADDPVGLAAISRDLIISLGVVGRYAEAAQIAAAALDDAAALDEEGVRGLQGQLLQLVTLEPTARPLAADRLPGMELGELRGADRGTRELLAAITTHATLRLESAERALEAGQRAIDAGIAEEVTRGPIAWTNTVYPLIVAEGYDLAEVLLRDAFDRAGRTMSAVGAARAHTARAMLQLRRGRLREAAADAELAIHIGREGGFTIWVLGLAHLVEALVEQGADDAASRSLAESGRDGEMPDDFLSFWLLHARGRLRAAEGRRGAAVADFEECLRRGQRHDLHNPAMTPYRSSLALALLADDPQRALALAEEELELARRWGPPRAIGVSLRAVALIRGAGAAELPLLTESAELLVRAGAQVETARSLIEMGAALRRANRRSEAREPLHRGMEIAHGCGAEPLVAHAREELVAAGARPRRVMRTGVDALTGSQLRVARMAAEGMSNREIAQALYVTLRTVELHLTNAYMKLDIHGREELAAALGTS